jgi:predicted transcriptional regulator
MYGVWYHTWMGTAHKTTLYLPSDLQRRLREYARRTGAPQAAVVRAAIERYLAETPRPVLTSLGVGEDEGLDAADARVWLRAHWENERP